VDGDSGDGQVLKPTGSLFVELDDKYSGNETGGALFSSGSTLHTPDHDKRQGSNGRRTPYRSGAPAKSLLGLPWRYALGCIDQLGLILRAEIVWEHVNGLPESVRDRVRRGHSRIFHLTKNPRYYAALDELREPQAGPTHARGGVKRGSVAEAGIARNTAGAWNDLPPTSNPLGKLPGSVWPIPSDPLRLPSYLGVNHYACVDTETEVLTRRGWLELRSLQADDQIAGYNLDTGLAEWTRLHGIFAARHDGEMVAVEKRDLSMRLTTNHRALAYRHRGRGRVRSSLEVVMADQLGPQHFIPRSADWLPDPQAKSIGVELAALCGWVAAEGWYQGISSVRLSQSKTANAENVERIDALIDGLHYTPVAAGQRWRQLIQTHRMETQQTWRGRPWVDVQWRLPLGLAQEIRRLMPDKLLTAELANLVEDEAQALLDAFLDGDGHRRGNRISIFQKHRANLDWLQMIAVRLGYKTTLRYGGGRWVLYLTKGGRPITLRGTNGANTPVSREHYSGTVWCIQTGTGTFIARRNGSVFITGNSYPPELVRRIVLGWSPSGICVECGEGRRPVVERQFSALRPVQRNLKAAKLDAESSLMPGGKGFNGETWEPGQYQATILGWACSCCPFTDHPGTGEGQWAQDERKDGQLLGLRAEGASRRPAMNHLEDYRRVGPWREYHLDGWIPPPTRPAVVVDPFGGTGTTAMVARALGRIGLSFDLSHAYSRAANWRIFESGEWQQVIERTTGRRVRPLPKHDPAQERLYGL
jgi:hypothetical protein